MPTVYNAHKCFHELICRKPEDIHAFSINSQEWIDVEIAKLDEIDVEVTYFTLPLMIDHLMRLNDDFPNITKVNLLYIEHDIFDPSFCLEHDIDKLKQYLASTKFNFTLMIDSRITSLIHADFPEGVERQICTYALNNFFWREEYFSLDYKRTDGPIYQKWFSNIVKNNEKHGIGWINILRKMQISLVECDLV